MVQNSNGSASNDTLSADRRGDVTLTGNDFSNFKIVTRGIQDWYITPSTVRWNKVTIDNLAHTPTKQVEVVASSSTVDAATQKQ